MHLQPRCFQASFTGLSRTQRWLLMFIDIPEGFQASSPAFYNSFEGVPDAREQHDRIEYSVVKDISLGDMKGIDVFS